MNLKFDMVVAKALKDDGGYYLEGVASTTDLDQHKEQMAESALQDMLKATDVRLTKDHEDEISSHIGDLVSSRIDDGAFIAKFKMDDNDPEAMRMWNKISNGMHAGLSVGGSITTTKPGSGMTKRIITGVNLEHVALTRKPANPNTMVQAFSKTIDKMNSEDESTMETELNKTDEPVDYILTAKNALSKVGKSISAENMDKLKSIQSLLGELMGDGDDDIIGDDLEAKFVDPVPGGPAEIKGDANIEKTLKEVVREEVGSLVKSSVIEALSLLKSERKSVIENMELEKTETPAESFAKAKSITDLRGLFNKFLTEK